MKKSSRSKKKSTDTPKLAKVIRFPWPKATPIADVKACISIAESTLDRLARATVSKHAAVIPDLITQCENALRGAAAAMRRADAKTWPYMTFLAFQKYAAEGASMAARLESFRQIHAKPAEVIHLARYRSMIAKANARAVRHA